MREILLRDKKELEDLCDSYANGAFEEKTERLIIAKLNKISYELSLDEEDLVSDIINKLYVHTYYNQKIMLKGCELALKVKELGGKPDLYIIALLHSLPFQNDKMLVTIVNSEYFQKNYSYNISLINEYIKTTQKYQLYELLLLHIKEIRCLYYKDIIDYYFYIVNQTVNDCLEEYKKNIPKTPEEKNKENQLKNYKQMYILKKRDPGNFIIYILFFVTLLFIWGVYYLYFYGYLDQIIEFLQNKKWN